LALTHAKAAVENNMLDGKVCDIVQPIVANLWTFAASEAPPPKQKKKKFLKHVLSVVTSCMNVHHCYFSSANFFVAH
jgi:hypothetical protein